MGDLLTWVLSRPQTAKQRSLARETLRAGNPDLKGKEVLALALYQTTPDGPKNIGKQLGISQDGVRDMIRGLGLPAKPHASTRRKTFGKASLLVTKWNALLKRARKPLILAVALSPEHRREKSLASYYANHETNKAAARKRAKHSYQQKKNDPDFKAKKNAHARRWKANNKEKRNRWQREYLKANPDKRKQYRRQSESMPHVRMTRNLRARLRELVREGLAYRVSRAEFIGCSPKQLVDHITSLFKPGMGWDNYGRWHLDHIKPCASFDLTDRQQVLACFHYTNLQPLWKQENEQKNSWHNGVRYMRGKAVDAAA